MTLAVYMDDRHGRILAYYNYCHMLLNAKIVKNVGVADAYRNFKDKMADIHNNFIQDAPEDLRWRANACYHEIFYGWLIGKKAPTSETLNFLKNLPENLKPAFCLDIIWAIEALGKSSIEAASMAFRVFMTEPPERSVEDQANALVVHYAAIKASGGCPDWLIPELDKIQAQGHGGHLARAAIEHGLV